jgi:hypothetical protein
MIRFLTVGSPRVPKQLWMGEIYPSANELAVIGEFCEWPQPLSLDYSLLIPIVHRLAIHILRSSKILPSVIGLYSFSTSLVRQTQLLFLSIIARQFALVMISY